MNKSFIQLAEKISNLDKNTHICAFYKNPQERLLYLAAYYSVGIEREEMCVFVSKEKPREIISQLDDVGLDIKPYVSKGIFHIFPDKSTYIPKGKFEPARMLNNLREFTDNASRKKLSGVRGGGDMDWIAINSDSWDSVGEYESKINRFIRTASFTGICMFPDQMLMSSNLTSKIIQNHQFMMKNGDLLENPYYSPPERDYRFDIKIIAEIEKWLDSVDSKESSRASAY